MSRSDVYVSTRGRTSETAFGDAVLMGLATDGGLLLPAELPDVRAHLDVWEGLPYPELALAVMAPFVGEGVPRPRLKGLLERAYRTFDCDEVVPVRRLGQVHVMELYHGPTLAFKDVALQFLGNLFEHILSDAGSELNILGATSGDTGSAAIAGVRGKAGMEIFIMHPHRRVSPIQERQMTCVLDDNVHNIAVRGTFDDGQRVMKEVFNDIPFKRAYHLGAVNSVNWARVLAQIVYYFYAALVLRRQSATGRVRVCVPTGNFGNVFAGYLACRMGAPISRLVLATNENDILSRFFRTGVYERGTVHPTTSPSMDIQVASNFERYLYYRVGRDPVRVRELMETFAREGRLEIEGSDPLFAAGRGTVQDAAEVIRRYHREHNCLVDPHTAVGIAVGERHLSDDEPTVCLATAHPAKFPATIREIVADDNAARHPAIDALAELPTRCVVLDATKDAVQGFIREVLGPRDD